MAGQQFIDNIANNLANVNTAGYRRAGGFSGSVVSDDPGGGTPATTGAQVPTGIQIGHGVRQVATQKIFTQVLSNRRTTRSIWSLKATAFCRFFCRTAFVAYRATVL